MLKDNDDEGLPWDENGHMVGSAKEDDLAEAAEYHPHIKPGEYEAKYVRHNVGQNPFKMGHRKIYIYFEIDFPGEDKPILFMCCPYPPKSIPVKPGSKYYKQWMLINGGPAKKGQIMSPAILRDKRIKIAVRDAEARNHNGQSMGPISIYSVVDCVIQIISERPCAESETKNDV